MYGNKAHLTILKQGVDAWNSWRENNPRVQPDLRGALLSYALLKGAKLIYADFSDAILNFADFTNADVSGARFRRADLSNAKFINANLIGAKLSYAELNCTDLSRATVGWTTFGDNDLSVVKGLDSISHIGPSIIGIRTLFQSNGNIPETFLVGAGVPDDFITYIPSLTTKAINFHSCFISYSTKDEEFSRRLYSRMRDAHIRVWFAPEDIRGGKKLYGQVEQAIQIHDKLLIVLSENSLQSEWVITEIRNARKAEIKESKRKLFPIRLVNMEMIQGWECFDADNGKDLAIEVREYFIPNFSNWKENDAFESAFDRLLRDLKADE